MTRCRPLSSGSPHRISGVGDRLRTGSPGARDRQRRRSAAMSRSIAGAAVGVGMLGHMVHAGSRVMVMKRAGGRGGGRETGGCEAGGLGGAKRAGAARERGRGYLDGGGTWAGWHMGDAGDFRSPVEVAREVSSPSELADFLPDLADRARKSKARVENRASVDMIEASGAWVGGIGHF